MQDPIEAIATAGKDCLYRMKDPSDIHWRNILYIFAKQSINITTEANQVTHREQGPKCLMFDDSTLAKCGRRIELIPRVWDHVTNRFVLGFKVPGGLYYDGTSCLPVDFSIHREKGKNAKTPYGLKKKDYKKVYPKSRQRNSPGYKRVKEADQPKIEMVLKMIGRAISKGLPIDYILMDSWFTCWAFLTLPAQLNENRSNPVRLIGMYKSAKTKFDWGNQSLTHAQIRESTGKVKRCRKLKYYYKEAIVEWKGQPIKLFFSKEGKKGKWETLLTTDTSLSFIEMIKTYRIRWAIEVFFKEAKQSLGLGKCQSNGFDAQIADTALVMVRYMISTLRRRFEQYEGKGALFEQDQNKVVAFKISERLWGLLLEPAELIETLFEGVDGQEIIAKMFDNEKANKLIGQFRKEPLDCQRAALSKNGISKSRFTVNSTKVCP